MPLASAASAAPALRSVCLVVPQLDPVVRVLQRLLDVPDVHRDPRAELWGIENAVLSLGATALEVCAPIRPGAAAHRFLARHPNGGGFALTFGCNEMEKRKRRVERLGVRVVADVDEPGLRLLQLHPRDCGGCMLQFDGTAAPPARDDAPIAMTAVELRTKAPLRVAEQWSTLAQMRVSRQPAHASLAAAGGVEIRVMPSDETAPDGLAAIDLAVRDLAAVWARASEIGIAHERADCAVAITNLRLRFVPMTTA